MDAWEATKAMFDRVYALDPENAAKIMGLLLIHDNSDKELIRLAFGPEHLLHAFVATAHAELATGNGKLVSPSPPVLGPLQTGPAWGGLPSPCPLSTDHRHRHRHNSPFAPMANQLGYDAVADAFYGTNDYDVLSTAGGAAHRRSFSLSDAEVAASAGGGPGAWRPCMYFMRGFCKNGSSYRFIHGLPEDDAAAAAAEREREIVVLRTKALATARSQ